MIIVNENRKGNVYIKRGPEVVEFSEEQAKKLESLKKIEDKTTNIEIAIKILEDFKKHAGEKNYSGCNDFWLGQDNGLNYILTSKQKVNGATNQKTYENFDDMYKSFIDLREFLDEAEYVGRKFKYPEGPKKTSIKGLMNMEAERTLLYRTNDIWLIFSKSLKDGGEGFEILHRSNKENFDYEFYGEPTEEFRDKIALDDAIYKKLTNNPAKRV